MKMRYLVVLLIGLLAVSGSVLAEEKVVVTDSPTTHHISLYIGLEMGIFKKYGLDVVYIKQPTAPDSYKAIAEGKADMLMACPTATIVEIDKGSPIKVIAQVKSPCTSILAVPAGSRIKTIKGLKGKKVSGISPTCEAILAFKDAALREGVDFELVKLPPGQAMPMLEKGELDGSILEEPYASEMELKGYRLKFRELIQVPCRFLSARVDFLQRRPEVAKKFVEALKEINELFNKNPISDEIVEIAHKYTGASKEAIKHGNVRIHLVTDLNLVRIKALVHSLVRTGGIKEPLEDEELYSEVFRGITWGR